MTLEKLQVIIEAQTKQYMDAMKKVQNQTNSTVSKVNSVVNAIKNALNSIGKIVGVAFSTVAIFNFGKACVQLGSDLAEVQNVVDVTFGEGNKTIESFAKNAATQFGLSELSAKQYTSTMGAMLKSMGMTGAGLEDMSMKLAGLAGDMASFYNLDTDTAFQKIRSGISGETEPLKQLGINLSVANLEAYALTQGIKKNYSAMTQQEQALLRYNYLLEVTKDAQGDFSRTSDSWANQTRILSLQFDTLKATLGQGLINVLTPVIQVLNTIISKLQIAADAFKSFTDIISGKKGSSSVASDLNDATSGAETLTSATKAAGGAAKKAEEAFHGLGKFDEINSLTKTSEGSGGGGGASETEAIPDVIGDAAEETDTELNPVLQVLIDRLNELKELFKGGFMSGLGNVSLEPLKNAISSIKTSLIDIFTDNDVVSAANQCIDKWVKSLGQITGSLASVGITIATNIFGGIEQYLVENSNRIKAYFSSMFEIGGNIGENIGNFSQAFANIFSAFGGESGQGVTSNLLGIFGDAFMGVTELFAKTGEDALSMFTAPIIDNQDGIKEALEGVLSVFEDVTGTIKGVVDDVVDKAHEVYDEHIGPMFESFKTGLSDTAGVFVDTWNTLVQPILDRIGNTTSSLFTEHIKPACDKILEFLGAIADKIKETYESYLKPAVDWLIQNGLPWIMSGLENLWNTLCAMFGDVFDLIGSLVDDLLQIFNGIIDFLVGVFTGDWEKAWNGIKDIFSGIWDAIKKIVEVVIGWLKDFINTGLTTIKSTVTNIFTGIKTIIVSIITGIKTGISQTLTAIKNNWSSMWTGMKTTVISIFNAIWSGIKGVINSIIGGIEGMANAVVSGINTVIDALNNLSFDIPDWVPELGGQTFGFNIPNLSEVSLPRLAKGGIVDGATPLIAGEAGKEAIVPLENNTGWIDSIAAKVAEILSVNIMGALENRNDDEFEITTNVNLDSKTIVTQTDKYRKRTGYKMATT